MKIAGEIHRNTAAAGIPGELGQRIGLEVEDGEERLPSAPFSSYQLLNSLLLLLLLHQYHSHFQPSVN